MSQAPWTFVPIAAGKVSTQECQWCRSNINVKDWDHNVEGFMFKHEQDAIIFSLKWS